MSITIRKGVGTPTTNTAGFIGEIYEDTNTGNRFECTGMYKTTGAKAYGPDYDYIWEKIDMIEEKRIPGNIGSGSGSGIEDIVYSYEYDESDSITNQKLTYSNVVITEFLLADDMVVQITNDEYSDFYSFIKNNFCRFVKKRDDLDDIEVRMDFTANVDGIFSCTGFEILNADREP